MAAARLYHAAMCASQLSVVSLVMFRCLASSLTAAILVAAGVAAGACVIALWPTARYTTQSFESFREVPVWHATAAPGISAHARNVTQLVEQALDVNLVHPHSRHPSQVGLEQGLLWQKLQDQPSTSVVFGPSKRVTSRDSCCNCSLASSNC